MRDDQTQSLKARQERRRQKRDRIQQEWSLCNDKLGALRKAATIETNAARQFELQQQIKTVELELSKLETQLTELEQEPVPTDILHNLPYLRATRFVGRADDLKRITAQLETPGAVAICSVQGMGGIGKTELALQFAHHHLQTQDYPGGICWLNARVDVELQLVRFARSQLALQIPEGLDLDGQVAFCWRHWMSGQVLLVLDDVQADAEIAALLDGIDPRFRILLTTRSRLGSMVREVAIKVLSEAEALELLGSLVPDGRLEREWAQTERLCEWLGYLPLGLELVGRYLADDPGITVGKVWARLQQKRLAAEVLKATYPGMTATVGVAAAFELSWERLPEAAQQVAKLLSLFALSEIPWELVQLCLPEWDEEELEVLRNRQLVNGHLLMRSESGEYKLHQLLREFFASKVSEPERKSLKTAFAKSLIGVAQQIPETPTLEQIATLTPAIPHLKELATDLLNLQTQEDLYIPDDNNLITVFVRIGWFHQGQGFYAEAEPWYEDSLAVVRSLLGEQHPDVATSLHNLANLYHDQGRYEDAEPLFTQALQLLRSLLGEQHPDVATSLNNLAGLYRDQGRYEDAEPLYTQALQLYRSLLGEQHPHVATSLNNLAALYYYQGRLAEAEPLFEQALDLFQKILGNQHPSTVTTRQWLATVQQAIDQTRQYRDEAQILA